MPSESTSDKPIVSLTSEAAAKVKDVLQQSDGKYLRVGVRRDSDASFEYVIGLEVEYDPDTDLLNVSQNIQVLVDRDSAPYLEGTVVDWLDNDRGAGFVFINPQAEKARGD